MNPAKQAMPPPRVRESSVAPAIPVDILIVDDETRNLDVLESILYLPGYRLVRASSANEALLALVHGDFAALVLDIHMPEMNGIELANLIKQRKRTRNIPIIFLTAYYADEKYALEGYEVGAVDYLTKPVNPDILRMKVAVFVELHRQSVALAESNRQLQLEVAQRQRSEELLREANSALENRVRERTAELSNSNLALRTSEGRLRDTLSTIPAGVCTCDREGRITFFNAAAAALWGREPEAGRDLWCGSFRMLRLDGSPLSHEESPLALAMREGRAIRGREIVIEREDGSRRQVMPYPEPIRDAAGHVIGGINMLVDVTDEKVAIDALRRHEERTSQLMALMPVGVYACDAEGQITFFNRRAVELWGRAPELNAVDERYCGSHQLYLPDGSTVRRESSPMAVAVRDGQAFRNLELIIARPDKSRFHSNISIGVLRDAADKVTGAICVFQDITERKEAERRAEFLNQLGRQLASLSDAGEILRLACRVTGSHLGVDRCCFAVWHPDLEKATVIEDWHLPGRPSLSGAYAVSLLGLSDSIVGSPTGYVDCEDAWVDGPPAESVRAMGLRSWAMARCGNDEAAGAVALVVAENRPRRWTQYDRHLLENIGMRVWPAVERARAAAALQAKEQQLRLVTDTASIMLVQFDASRRFVFANRAFCENVGLAADKVMGREVREVMGEQAAEALAPYMARVLAGREVQFELTLQLSGADRVMAASFVPEVGPQGRIRGWVTSLSDITDRHRAHKAARDLAAIVESSDDAIIGKDLDGVIQSWNRGAQKLYGYEANEIIGKPVLSLIPSERHAEETGILERIRQGRTVEHFETVRLRKDGSLVEVSLSISPIRDEKGQIVGASKIARDISDQKRVERELRQRESQLEAAQAELRQYAQTLEQKVQERTASLTDAIAQMEEFSYTVSHDLRAPLRAMNSYSEALLLDYSAQLDVTARDYLTRIQRSSLRMEKLTHDMLMYSRLARTEVKLESLDLGVLLRDLINQYEEFQAPRSIVEVVDPLHAVRAHEVSLGQCIANLMTNAVKFVAPGVQPRIRIHTEEREGFVRLWIADNGIGIPPQYHDRIFQVFERLHAREQYEGTGMGLAIVRKVMEKTGGRCGLESTGQQGSRFWLELPKP